MAKVYSLAEVAEHNTREDFWIILLGKVYNITTFLDEHPGGDEVLLNTSGKDATQEFDDVGHSHEAWAMLDKYYVGEFDKSSLPTTKTDSLKTANKKGKKNMIVFLMQFLVPLVILNVCIFLFSKSSS